jgi:hypothetical protein
MHRILSASEAHGHPEDNMNMSTVGKAVNREDKQSRRYRDRHFAKFERSRRYRDR